MRRLLVVAVGALALAAPGASAETIDVTADDDVYAVDGRCTLREAITSANLDGAPFVAPGECPNGSGGDTIRIPALHVTLSRGGIKDNLNSTGDLDILGPTTIIGAGSAATTIDAAGIDRVLDVGIAGSVTLQGLKLTGGHAPDGGPGTDDINGLASVGNGESATGGSGGNGEPGGGIRNAGTLTILDSAVVGNAAGSGGKGGNAEGGAGATAASGGFGGAATSGFGGLAGGGGGIYSTAKLTLTRVVVADNQAGAGGAGGTATGGQGGGATSGNGGGGGIASAGNGGLGGAGGGLKFEGSTLLIDLCTFTGNHAGASGNGGLAQGGAGNVGVTSGGSGGSGFGGDSNEAGSGGAIEASGSTVSVMRTLIASNSGGTGGNGGEGKGGNGGALFGASGSAGSGGHGTGGNGLSGGGGGGVHTGSSAMLVNVTAMLNTSGGGGNGGKGTGRNGGAGGSGNAGFGGSGSGGDGGSAGHGGGLMPYNTATIDHATITDNGLGAAGGAGTATAGAGGVNGVPASGGTASPGTAGATGLGGAIFSSQLTLRNSIVAGNASPACHSTTPIGAHDISLGDATCPGADANPLLAALADNGGPSQTRIPGPGSPAIDAVPADANCAATDQRGATRPHGAGCEIGAYEIAPPQVAITDAAATVLGTVNPNARAATYHFDYGTGTAYGSSTQEGSLPAGIEPVAVSAALAGLAAGTTYHVRLVASNADGTTLGEDRTFMTSATGGGPGGGPGADTTAPVILSASVKPKTFRRRRGTTFHYRLSEAAGVAFTIQRKKGKRYVKAKRFTKASKAGANKKKFVTRKLKPGRYRATLVATDAAGNRSKAKRLAFRIRRR